MSADTDRSSEAIHSSATEFDSCTAVSDDATGRQRSIAGDHSRLSSALSPDITSCSNNLTPDPGGGLRTPDTPLSCGSDSCSARESLGTPDDVLANAGGQLAEGSVCWMGDILLPAVRPGDREEMLRIRMTETDRDIREPTNFNWRTATGCPPAKLTFYQKQVSLKPINFKNIVKESDVMIVSADAEAIRLLQDRLRNGLGVLRAQGDDAKEFVPVGIKFSKHRLQVLAFVPLKPTDPNFYRQHNFSPTISAAELFEAALALNLKQYQSKRSLKNNNKESDNAFGAMPKAGGGQTSATETSKSYTNFSEGSADLRSVDEAPVSALAVQALNRKQRNVDVTCDVEEYINPASLQIIDPPLTNPNDADSAPVGFMMLPPPLPSDHLDKPPPSVQIIEPPPTPCVSPPHQDDVDIELVPDTPAPAHLQMEVELEDLEVEILQENQIRTSAPARPNFANIRNLLKSKVAGSRGAVAAQEVASPATGAPMPVQTTDPVRLTGTAQSVPDQRLTMLTAAADSSISQYPHGILSSEGQRWNSQNSQGTGQHQLHPPQQQNIAGHPHQQWMQHQIQEQNPWAAIRSQFALPQHYQGVVNRPQFPADYQQGQNKDTASVGQINAMQNYSGALHNQMAFQNKSNASTTFPMDQGNGQQPSSLRGLSIQASQQPPLQAMSSLALPSSPGVSHWQPVPLVRRRSHHSSWQQQQLQASQQILPLASHQTGPPSQQYIPTGQHQMQMDQHQMQTGKQHVSHNQKHVQSSQQLGLTSQQYMQANQQQGQAACQQHELISQQHMQANQQYGLAASQKHGLTSQQHMQANQQHGLTSQQHMPANQQYGLAASQQYGLTSKQYIPANQQQGQNPYQSDVAVGGLDQLSHIQHTYPATQQNVGIGGRIENQQTSQSAWPFQAQNTPFISRQLSNLAAVSSNAPCITSHGPWLKQSQQYVESLPKAVSQTVTSHGNYGQTSFQFASSQDLHSSHLLKEKQLPLGLTNRSLPNKATTVNPSFTKRLPKFNVKPASRIPIPKEKDHPVTQASTQAASNVVVLAPIDMNEYKPDLARELLRTLADFFRVARHERYLGVFETMLAGDVGSDTFAKASGIDIPVVQFYHFRCSVLKGNINLADVHPGFSGRKLQRREESLVSNFNTFYKFMRENIRSNEDQTKFGLLFSADLSWKQFSVHFSQMEISEHDYWHFRKAIFLNPSLWRSTVHPLLNVNEFRSDSLLQEANETRGHGFDLDMKTTGSVILELREQVVQNDGHSKFSVATVLGDQCDDEMFTILDTVDTVAERSSEASERLHTPSPIIDDVTQPKEAPNIPNEEMHTQHMTSIDFDKVHLFEQVFGRRFSDPMLSLDSRKAAKEALLLFINGSLSPEKYVSSSRLNWGKESIAETLASWLPHIQGAVFQKKFLLSSLHWMFNDVEVDLPGQKLSVAVSILPCQDGAAVSSHPEASEEKNLLYKGHCRILFRQEVFKVCRKFLAISASDKYLFLPESFSFPEGISQDFPLACIPWGEKKVKVTLPDGRNPAKKIILHEVESYEEFEKDFLNVPHLHMSSVIVSAGRFKELCLQFEVKNHMEICVEVLEGDSEFIHTVMHELLGEDNVCNSFAGKVYNQDYVVVMGAIYLIFLARRDTGTSVILNGLSFGESFKMRRFVTESGVELCKLKLRWGLFQLNYLNYQLEDVRRLAASSSSFVSRWKDFRFSFGTFPSVQIFKLTCFRRKIVAIASADLCLGKKPIHVVLVYLKPIRVPNDEDVNRKFLVPRVDSLLKFDCISLVTENICELFKKETYAEPRLLEIKETEQQAITRCQFTFLERVQSIVVRALVKPPTSEVSLGATLETENVLLKVATIEDFAAARRKKGQDCVANWKSLLGVKEASAFHENVVSGKVWKNSPASSPIKAPPSASIIDGTASPGKKTKSASEPQADKQSASLLPFINTGGRGSRGRGAASPGTSVPEPPEGKQSSSLQPHINTTGRGHGGRGKGPAGLRAPLFRQQQPVKPLPAASPRGRPPTYNPRGRTPIGRTPRHPAASSFVTAASPTKLPTKSSDAACHADSPRALNSPAPCSSPASISALLADSPTSSSSHRSQQGSPQPQHTIPKGSPQGSRFPAGKAPASPSGAVSSSFTHLVTDSCGDPGPGRIDVPAPFLAEMPDSTSTGMQIKPDDPRLSDLTSHGVGDVPFCDLEKATETTVPETLNSSANAYLDRTSDNLLEDDNSGHPANVPVIPMADAATVMPIGEASVASPAQPSPKADAAWVHGAFDYIGADPSEVDPNSDPKKSGSNRDFTKAESTSDPSKETINAIGDLPMSDSSNVVHMKELTDASPVELSTVETFYDPAVVDPTKTLPVARALALADSAGAHNYNPVPTIVPHRTSWTDTSIEVASSNLPSSTLLCTSQEAGQGSVDRPDGNGSTLEKPSELFAKTEDFRLDRDTTKNKKNTENDVEALKAGSSKKRIEKKRQEEKENAVSEIRAQGISSDSERRKERDRDRHHHHQGGEKKHPDRKSDKTASKSQASKHRSSDDKESRAENKKEQRTKKRESSDRIVPLKRVVDLYLADVKELEDIPGIDDTLAQSIVEGLRLSPSYSNFIKSMSGFNLLTKKVQQDVGALARGDIILAFNGTKLDRKTLEKEQGYHKRLSSWPSSNVPVPVQIAVLGMLKEPEFEEMFRKKQKESSPSTWLHWVKFTHQLYDATGGKLFVRSKSVRKADLQGGDKKSDQKQSEPAKHAEVKKRKLTEANLFENDNSVARKKKRKAEPRSSSFIAVRDERSRSKSIDKDARRRDSRRTSSEDPEKCKTVEVEREPMEDTMLGLSGWRIARDSPLDSGLESGLSGGEGLAVAQLSPTEKVRSTLELVPASQANGNDDDEEDEFDDRCYPGGVSAFIQPEATEALRSPTQLKSILKKKEARDGEERDKAKEGNAKEENSTQNFLVNEESEEGKEMCDTGACHAARIKVSNWLEHFYQPFTEPIEEPHRCGMCAGCQLPANCGACPTCLRPRGRDHAARCHKRRCEQIDSWMKKKARHVSEDCLSRNDDDEADLRTPLRDKLLSMTLKVSIERYRTADSHHSDMLYQHLVNDSKAQQQLLPASAREAVESASARPINIPDEDSGGATSRSKHFCSCCQLSFDSEAAIRRHILVQHVPLVDQEKNDNDDLQQLFSCFVCSERFSSQSMKYYHVKSVHRDGGALGQQSGGGPQQPDGGGTTCLVCWKVYSGSRAEHEDGDCRRIFFLCTSCPAVRLFTRDQLPRHIAATGHVDSQLVRVSATDSIGFRWPTSVRIERIRMDACWECVYDDSPRAT